MNNHVAHAAAHLPAVALDTSRAADQSPVTAAQRLDGWLRRLGDNTARAYARDLEVAAAYMQAESVGAALDRLCNMQRARALTLIEGWRDVMKSDGLSSATINRRLAALNSALREIGKADIGHGRLDVTGIKTERRRDVRGPGLSKIGRVIEDLTEEGSARAVRDIAILRLAAQRGLRRSEIVSLTIADLFLDQCEIRIARKGKRERVAVQLAPACCAAILDWVAIRTDHAGDGVEAVFVELARNGSGQPLSGHAVFMTVRRLGAKRGEVWRPHGLRHSAITHALKATGNLESARAFAGHASVTTTQGYIDDSVAFEKQAVDALADAF